ncbi:Rhodanese-like protein [Coniophora puteana RWD-64-598 SS2]|uniref:Rhodanese-like protein n=1 Tax=Coniophora puteana (strain RWD-64-598) TaxID=741705 RepID=A0A5M3N6P3_CONPW|nr:Rhodanese-like protein [Coniophora puteana RWD-64-598 SS2]EIW86515.1 Rhodanese-like protein [Coniophora puteana RWD-64-598 SS2]
MLFTVLARRGASRAGDNSRLALSSGRRWISTTKPAPMLVSPKELQQLLPSGQVSLLDATWFMPGTPRSPREEHSKERIRGSQFLNLDEVANQHELGLKHMMPSPRVFADACEKLGIKPSSHVVIYDTHGVFSSPRALFMFRAFGHRNSSILNGGLPLWELEGHSIDNAPLEPVSKASYPVPQLDKEVIRSYEQVVSNSLSDPTTDSSIELLVDARSRGRFLGTDPEPRPGMSSGHVPHSFSLPFNTFLKMHKDAPVPYTTFKSVPELKEALKEAVGPDNAESVIKGERKIVASCGSGMTAGVLWLGLKLLGTPDVAIYDESWTGYASRSSSKIEKGT